MQNIMLNEDDDLELEFDNTVPSQDSYDATCCFDDEIDAALAPDFRVTRMISEIADLEIDDPDFDDVEEYEDIDISNDDIEDVSDEDLDAEDLAAADKEVLNNPFEDDEIIDAAIGNGEDMFS